ncbi:MAG: spore cortex biosynthesis protein YabQ [Bacillota bacterium]|nr:spore cortex biosynthesis protein YabQ [Bacillota bacterium]HHU62048.1 spore cortex biosynthesis protein YabQ [Natronincola sp.]
MEPLGTQLYAFGIVLIAGISLGILFDLFRVLRGILRPGFLSTPLLDLLFWALFTPILLLYLLLANWGELRGYVFIALILGFFFYRLLFSTMVTSFLVWVVKIVSGLLNLLICFLLWLGSFPLLLIQEIKFSRALRISRRLKPRLRWKKFGPK